MIINAAIVGLGWWGKQIVGSLQRRSCKFPFIRGVGHAWRMTDRKAGDGIAAVLEAIARSVETGEAAVFVPTVG